MKITPTMSRNLRTRTILFCALSRLLRLTKCMGVTGGLAFTNRYQKNAAVSPFCPQLYLLFNLFTSLQILFQGSQGILHSTNFDSVEAIMRATPPLTLYGKMEKSCKPPGCNGCPGTVLRTFYFCPLIIRKSML